MRALFVIIAALLFSTYVQAQVLSAKVETTQPKCLERVDVGVELVGEWENPFFAQQASLDMIVVAPSAKRQVVPCYYAQGKSGATSKWQARYTPAESGEYSCTFVYRQKGREVKSNVAVSFDVAPSQSRGFLRANNNYSLKFDNGVPFRGIGQNLCWESRDVDDSKFFKALHERDELYNYDYMMPLLARNGANFFRVWMCSWNMPIDFKDGFNNSRYTTSDEFINESAARRLDHVVNLAQKLDMYIMLCMGAGDVATDSDFFVSAKAKERYKNRARYIIARWGYSPNIAMWEMFNEIDNIQYKNSANPIAAADIVAWHTEMCRYFKETDPYSHLLTTSISHRDLQGLNSIADMDINQKHIYRRTAAIPAEIEKYTKEFGKPYIIGEFGYEWDWSKNFDEFGAAMDTDFRRGLWYGLFSPTPVTPMSWWWEYFENRGMIPYFRGVRQISDMMLADGKGDFTPLKVTCQGNEAFALRCGKTIYAYLCGTQQSVAPMSIDVKGGRYSVRSFNPSTLTFMDLGVVDASKGMTLKEVKLDKQHEIVYIFTSI